MVRSISSPYPFLNIVFSQCCNAEGRRNWNVPKHLAKFTFTPSETVTGGTEIRIYAPTHIDGQQDTIFNVKPFFAALVQPSMLPIPALPLNLTYSPMSLVLVQPPLEQSDSVEKDGLVGTKRWCSILPNFEGKVKPSEDPNRFRQR